MSTILPEGDFPPFLCSALSQEILFGGTPLPAPRSSTLFMFPLQRKHMKNSSLGDSMNYLLTLEGLFFVNLLRWVMSWQEQTSFVVKIQYSMHYSNMQTCSKVKTNIVKNLYCTADNSLMARIP